MGCGTTWRSGTPPPSDPIHCNMAHKGNITILTLNVRGMHTAHKRYAVYAYIKRQNVQIALLQEMHLVPTELEKLCRRWRGVFCATTYSTYAQGSHLVAPRGPI